MDALYPDLTNDTSDAPFAIVAYLDVTAPENGMPVIAEEPYIVTWDQKGTGADIKTLPTSPCANMVRVSIVLP